MMGIVWAESEETVRIWSLRWTSAAVARDSSGERASGPFSG